MRTPHLAHFPEVFDTHTLSCSEYCSDPHFNCKIDLANWSPQIRLVFKSKLRQKQDIESILSQDIESILLTVENFSSGPVPAGEQCDDHWQEFPNIGMYGYT